MSIKGMTWAWEFARENKLTPTATLVLLRLGDHANPQTGLCCPSQADLADYARTSRPSVNRICSELERIGAVRIERRKRDDGSKTTNQYWLADRTSMFTSPDATSLPMTPESEDVNIGKTKLSHGETEAIAAEGRTSMFTPTNGEKLQQPQKSATVNNRNPKGTQREPKGPPLVPPEGGKHGGETLVKLDPQAQPLLELLRAFPLWRAAADDGVWLTTFLAERPWFTLEEARKFQDYHLPLKNGRKPNWRLALRNWRPPFDWKPVPPQGVEVAY